MTPSRPESTPVAIAPPPTDDAVQSSLGLIPTGVAVVTSMDGDRPIGVTLQCVCPVASDPPIALICPSLASTTWQRIAAKQHLCINLLADDQAEVARRFSAIGIDRFAGIDWSPGPMSGSPILAGVMAAMEGLVDDVSVAGDHLIVACRVTSTVSRRNARPLVYFKRRFARIESEC